MCSINVSHHAAFLCGMSLLSEIRRCWKSVNILGQPLNNKCADISEFEGKQIAVEICKFAKSNLVQVYIKLTYFAGVALNSIGVLDMARISWAQEYLEVPWAKVEVMQPACWKLAKVLNWKPWISLLLSWFGWMAMSIRIFEDKPLMTPDLLVLEDSVVRI